MLYAKPKLYWESSAVFMEFDLAVFRKHLDYEKEKLKPYDKRPGQCKPKNTKLGDKEMSRLM